MTPTSLVDLIDPFHAVDKGGNCLPGPYRPFGMARPGPDTLNPHTNGYATGQSIVGFSQTHVSGTGGAGRAGNILILPACREPRNPALGLQPTAEAGSAGYYTVTDGFTGIRSEITATARCALYRFSFPESASAWLKIDLGHVIAGESIGGFLEWLDDEQIVGRADYRGGWGHNALYSIYFAVRFSAPATSRSQEFLVQDGAVGRSDGPHAYAVAGFGCIPELEVAIGLSNVSVAQARRHLGQEMGERGFDAVRRETADIWEAVLQNHRVGGGTEAEKRLFYTFLYRLYCMPDDLGAADEDAWLPSKERQFNNLYCLWDSARNANSWFALTLPQFQADLNRALLEIGELTGWIPDSWINGHSAFIQGGSSADILFLEAVLKELPGTEPARLHGAMTRTAESPSPNPRFFGRYPEHRERGWLPVGTPNCVSRSIEYSFQDACATRLAAAAALPAAGSPAAGRVDKLWELWRDDLKCFAPRHADGEWVEPFDPWQPLCPDYWNDPFFYEGTAHEWAFQAMHLLPEIVTRHGGADAFCRHLDLFFERIYLWKEIILHTPFLYHYAGRPDLSARQVRRQLRQHYRSGREGLSDNEDMGSQSTFFIAASLGLYPIAGMDLYLLVPPLFPEANLTVGLQHKRLRLRVDGPTADDADFVGLTLNGVPLDRAWVRHSEICEGGDLLFHTTPEGNGSPFRVTPIQY
ncbi:MAG: GH92 family glycosyl hydrolase [Opitutales bacterium]|nr:GH92 family glycosyl hydrolase [Opitutales bacterium]